MMDRTSNSAHQNNIGSSILEESKRTWDDVKAFVPNTSLDLSPSGSGRLDGLSCGVKDVFDIAGHRTGYGNPIWKETHEVPSMDAPTISMLRRSGARIIGKTITDELAFSLAGRNYHYGAPINTRAPGRLSGGSSSGSAAAVAAGLCDIGLGTDTAGSVRAPASFCGVFGFRSTHSLISKEGICRLAPSFDTVGWFARSPQILAAVGDVMLPNDPPEEFGGFTSFENAWNTLPEDSRRHAQEILDCIGPAVERPSSPLFSIEELDCYVQAFRTEQFYEVWKELGPWIERFNPVLGPDIKERLTAAQKVTESEYQTARKVRREVKSRCDAIVQGGRVLLMPTVMGPAPLRTSSVDEVNNQRRIDLRLLCLASLAGLPQVSIPALSCLGAPLGFSLIGAAGTDRQLLEIATCLVVDVLPKQQQIRSELR